MSRIRSLTTAFAVLALVASVGAPVHAQDTTAASSLVAVAADSTPATDSASPVAPAALTAAAPTFMTASPIAMRAVVRTDAPVLPMMREPTSRSVALMIVGGAALIVGSVVGGDSGNIMMVGGGVIGLIGLWNYLK